MRDLSAPCEAIIFAEDYNHPSLKKKNQIFWLHPEDLVLQFPSPSQANIFFSFMYSSLTAVRKTTTGRKAR
jgi:hypothetical protein